jgi:hypothetical protein
MKQNKWLLIVLIVLAALTALFMLRKNDSTLKKELRDFAVKDTAAITKIFLADRNGNSITLERKAGKWVLNGKDEPKYDFLKLLMDAIYKVEVRTPVAKAAYNNVLKSLAASGIKCEIYLKGEGKPLKTYYVGGQTEDAMGTFMILENSVMPFITHIPGFNGYLTPRYNLSQDAWKSLLLFSYQSDEIKSVMVNYTNAPASSFIISRYNGRYNVQSPATNNFIQSADTVAIENYLAQYRNVYIESWLLEMDQKKKDSIAKNGFSIRISVKDNNNQLKEVDIFPMPVTKRSLAQTDSLGKELKYDLDRVYGMINPGNQFVTIQQPMLKRLLRQFSDFDAAKTKTQAAP